MSIKQYKIKMIVIVAAIFLAVTALFGFFMYMVFWQQTYYSVNIESYHKDNENLTEAFEKEKHLRKFLQQSLASEKVLLSRQEEVISNKDSLISRHRTEISRLQQEKFKAEKQVQKLKHEKDSILNIINRIPRVPAGSD